MQYKPTWADPGCACPVADSLLLILGESAPLTTYMHRLNKINIQCKTDNS